MAPKKSKASSSSAVALSKEWLDEEESWENDVASPTHEMDDEDDMEDSDEEVPDTLITGLAAQEELLSYLMERHRKGKMSATDMCIIAFWCGQSGLENLKGLGMRPQTQSGNFKRHVDSFVRKKYGVGEPHLYVVPIPCFVRATAERGLQDLICVPLHEALMQEVASMDVPAL